MKLLKLIRGNTRAFALVFVILLAMAFFELSLPRYTADIVDVGIMQKGIEVDAGDLDDIEAQRLVKQAQDEYIAQGGDLNKLQMRYLLRTGGLMLLFTLGMGICAAGVNLIASRTAARRGRELRQRIFNKVLSYSATEMNRFNTASLITRATNDVQQICMFIGMSMRMILYAPIIGIGGIIMVARTNISMGWTIALAVALILILIVVLFALTMPKFKLMQKLVDKVNASSREMLSGVPVIRAFGREELQEQRFDEASTQLMRTQLFTGRAMAFMGPTMALIMNGIGVLIVWVASSQIDAGIMQVGDMIAFITYSMVVISSFLMLNMIAIIAPRANVSAERKDEVLSTQAIIRDPEHPVDAATVRAAAGDQAGTIRFDHVSFRYEDAVDDALHDISFTARPGQTTAIIGSTGAGKSTLLQLILRFYDVREGSVSIDGVDVRDYALRDLRALVGYVPQKNLLFSGDIESNLKFAGERVDNAVMQHAADIAQASEFIATKEGGFQSEISKGGGNVSGGQRQRLAIARALATQAPILIFDDSFSALDYRTDRALRQALAQDRAGATILVVAQRIATIMQAQQIIVLDDGRMVGCGTHRELMRDCAAYREIALSQLSSSELEGGGTDGDR
ncbi:MAG: ABC transporter ATP-binding protein [Coriobacteriales bacterium]|nr:ABC transporter ATP-binding protein [Coriobacteriales bacterium]